MFLCLFWPGLFFALFSHQVSQSGNKRISVAVACHLIARIMHSPNHTKLTLDHAPSVCVAHAAWRSEALPVPPAKVLMRKDWTAVLEFLRVRCVCARSRNPPRARRATEPRCSFPHDLLRRIAPCSARTCRVRSAPRRLFSSFAAAACLRMFCSTLRCWGP